MSIIQDSMSVASAQASQHNHHSILDLVGNTPLLSFEHVTAHLPDTIRIFAKAEWYNPGGSIKDRPALNIIQKAIERGELGNGQILLDSTSGNTGIAYALFGAALGIKVKLVVPANVSPERVQILKAYGVDLILSDPFEGSDGAIREVRKLYAENPDLYFFANQYNNPDNPSAHYHSTGVEIWEQTKGEITHFLAGLGTSGTLMGTGKRLKEYNPEIELLALQPASPFHGLEGLKHMETAILPGVYDDVFPDAQVTLKTEAAYEMCRRLAREEGVLVGISSGAALASAVELGEKLAQKNQSATIVTVFPDSASKYLSEAFWTE